MVDRKRGAERCGWEGDREGGRGGVGGGGAWGGVWWGGGGGGGGGGRCWWGGGGGGGRGRGGGAVVGGGGGGGGGGGWAGGGGPLEQESRHSFKKVKNKRKNWRNERVPRPGRFRAGLGSKANSEVPTIDTREEKKERNEKKGDSGGRVFTWTGGKKQSNVAGKI